MKKFLQNAKRRVVTVCDRVEAGAKKLGGKVAVALGLGLVVGTTKSAHADLDLSGISFDAAPVETIGLAIITFLAVIWVIKVVINFIR